MSGIPFAEDVAAQIKLHGQSFLPGNHVEFMNDSQIKEKGVVVRCLTTGVLVKCGVPIDPGSFVFIKTEELGRLGSAYVRRCDPLLFTYQIGLQFASPLSLRF